MNQVFSEYIIQYLVNQGTVNWGSVVGSWPAIVGIMPDNDDNSDNFISVLDTGAEMDGVDHRSAKSVQHPTFQISIRSADYPVAYKKGKEIESRLEEILRTPVVIDGHTAMIQAVQVKTPTTFLKEQEKNRRQVFVLNIQTTMREL